MSSSYASAAESGGSGGSTASCSSSPSMTLQSLARNMSVPLPGEQLWPRAHVVTPLLVSPCSAVENANQALSYVQSRHAGIQERETKKTKKNKHDDAYDAPEDSSKGEPGGAKGKKKPKASDEDDDDEKTLGAVDMKVMNPMEYMDPACAFLSNPAVHPAVHTVGA